LVAVLTRIFGADNLQLAEDVVQEALLKALHTWKLKGIPDNPTAWLFAVARNRITDELRKQKKSDYKNGFEDITTTEWEEEIISDNQLKMMYICCNPGIPKEGQIALILRTLCGFGINEIAAILLSNRETISKRLFRARNFFRENPVSFQLPENNELQQRTLHVLNAIYLIFSEGYYSFINDQAIRPELVQEAIALVRLITENPETRCPEAFALLSLMCFHSSRETARISTSGEILLLEEQNRNLWDQNLVQTGILYLSQASYGDRLSSYHLEAAIACEHCTALSLEATNWQRILMYYDLLLRINSSAIIRLSRIIVIKQISGPVVAFKEFFKIDPLETDYLYYNLKGILFHEINDKEAALRCYQKALAFAPSENEKKLILSRMSKLNEG
jgi:RNA polymerase sigma factor (sigma-70 family)